MNVSGLGVRVRRFLRTPTGALIAVFSVLLALAGAATGWSSVFPHLLAAVAGAGLVDLLIARFDSHRLAWPSSAILSGLIVACVLDPRTPWAVTACLGALATISKHLIATNRWHVFNPGRGGVTAFDPCVRYRSELVGRSR